MSKTALITGCNSGLGVAVAEKLIEDGYSLIAHYHSDCSGIDRLIAANPEVKILKVQAELDKAGTEKIVKTIKKEAGSLKLIINNAGSIVREMTVSDIDWDITEKSFGVNMIAPLILSSSAFEVMRDNSGGKIINISSVGAKYGGGETTIHYGMAKSALDALTLNLSRQGAKFNILVNSVRPGVIDTDFHKKNTPGKDMAKRIKMVPLGRMASAEEVADLVAFLASDKADYITGEIITIAGGD